MPQISIDTYEHGRIAVIDASGAEVTELDEGEVGTVVGYPDDGYDFIEYYIDGEIIPIMAFLMPGADISVSGMLLECEEVQIELDQVAEAAENTQYFWTDNDGAHVTDTPQEEWTAAKEAGFPDISDSKPYANSLWTSLAMLFRTGLANLVSIGRSAVEFFDGNGNNAANVTASFGPDGVVIGKRNGIHAEVTPSYFNLRDENDSAPFYVSPSSALNWRSFGIYPYERPDINGAMRDGIGYGETVSYRVSGPVDLASYPLSVRLQFGWGDKTIAADGDYTIGGANGMGVTVASDADGVTVSLTNNREGFFYEFVKNKQSGTLISGWTQMKDFVIGLNSRTGITQTVAIGDKTLTVTGGIITGIS